MNLIKNFVILFLINFNNNIVIGQLIPSYNGNGNPMGTGLYDFGGQRSLFGNGYDGFGGSSLMDQIGDIPVWNIATMAFKSILSIQSLLRERFIQNQNAATVLSSLPDFDVLAGNELQSLIQSFSLMNQQTLQRYINVVSDPNLSKGDLANSIQQFSRESTPFGEVIAAALQKESNDWTTFNNNVKSISDLQPIVRNITTTRNNRNINYGEEVLSLINYLITLPSQLQYALCQQVEILTNNMPQYTTNGLASLSTTCQALEKMYSNSGQLNGNVVGYPGQFPGYNGGYPYSNGNFGMIPGYGNIPGGFSNSGGYPGAGGLPGGFQNGYPNYQGNGGLPGGFQNGYPNYQGNSMMPYPGYTSYNNPLNQYNQNPYSSGGLVNPSGGIPYNSVINNPNYGK